MARWLETDTTSNLNISSAVNFGSYTADADRLILCDVQVDQVVGNGDYKMHLTKRINNTGSSYVVLPKTTMTAASGETAIAGQSGFLSVRTNDVVKLYIDGLANDTHTPDVTVRWFEMAALRPATAGRTLLVDSTGRVTVSALAANTLDSTAVKASAVSKIQAGLALSSEISALNDLNTTAVQTAATAALNAYDPPTKSELDSAVSPLATSANITALNDLNTTQVQAAAAAALTAYDPPTKSELDSAVSPLATALALATVAGYIDTEITAIKAKTDLIPASPAAVGSAMTLAANALDSTAVKASAVTKIAAGVSVPSAAQNADAVWGELQSGHSTAGSFGLYLDSKVSEAGGGGLTVASIADGVWAETLSGHSTAGSAGAKLTSAAAASGSGAISWPITATVNSLPVDGAHVQVATDSAFANIVASGYTNASGVVTMLLDAGTYYVRIQHSRYTWTDTTITVSE